MQSVFEHEQLSLIQDLLNHDKRTQISFQVTNGLKADKNKMKDSSFIENKKLIFLPEWVESA